MLKQKYKTLLTAIFIIAALLAAAYAQAAADRLFHGNVNSYIFHAQHCRYFSCKNCVKVFHSRQEALDAGYRPCKLCKP